MRLPAPPRSPRSPPQGIIKRVKLDGPDRGTGKVDMLPRSVRHRIDDLVDDVSEGQGVRSSLRVQ